MVTHIWSVPVQRQVHNFPRRELQPQQRKTSNKSEFKKRDGGTGWSNKYLTYEVDLRRRVEKRTQERRHHYVQLVNHACTTFRVWVVDVHSSRGLLRNTSKILCLISFYPFFAFLDLFVIRHTAAGKFIRSKLYFPQYIPLRANKKSRQRGSLRITLVGNVISKSEET